MAKKLPKSEKAKMTPAWIKPKKIQQIKQAVKSPASISGKINFLIDVALGVLQEKVK